MELSSGHPLKVAAVMILLCLIMLPVAAGIVSFGQTLGARRDTNETFALSGRLIDAKEMVGNFREENLGMFSPKDKVYQITLAKVYQIAPGVNGEAKYGFFAALPESPKLFVGQQVILEYNRIRNIFGGVVMVEETGFGPLPVSIGTPIYGKIVINNCK
ncbi:MAG: hypothetical protein HY813_03630 [Candidatus Portnoybacteria bacterium]|nr:hypothetical protein [Candidatus Portnoybacteria bacterium]